MDLSARLRQLAAERATGRLDVLAAIGGRIYLDRGAVVCAEQHGQPTMLLAMADAGLFAPPEWAAALKAAPTERWRTVIGGDERRRRALVDFARLFTGTQLGLLLGRPTRSAVFVADAVHPLGTLAAWTLVELGAPAPTRPPIDRGEFLELLSEISPHVRPAPGRLAAAAPGASPPPELPLPPSGN